MLHLESSTGTDGNLQPCLPTQGIACPECGLYFDCTRTVHSHLARKHGCPPEKLARPKAKAYTQHAKDGMPHCRHCDRTFTRVEALKKHLQGSCPILHCKQGPRSESVRDNPKSTPTSVACGAAGAEELLGHPCRAPADGTAPAQSDTCEADIPLFDRPSFQLQLRRGWRQALTDPSHLAKLKEHCVFCNQWLSVKGPGVKQHHRLAHPERWKLKDDANSLCATAGSAATRPCTFCAGDYKDPRAHISRCPVLFQAAIASLALSQDTRDGRGGHGPIGGAAGDEGGLGRPRGSDVARAGRSEAALGAGEGGGEARQVAESGQQEAAGKRQSLGILAQLGAVRRPGPAEAGPGHPPPAADPGENHPFGWTRT